MKILVLISKVPDTTARIEFTDDDRSFKEAGVQFIVNPLDEWYALVRALEFKEKFEGSEVVLLSVGDGTVEPILRKAFGIGGDRAVRIDLETPDPMNVAFQISNYVKSESFDLIIGGKETISYNGNALMGMIAEYLELPFFSAISQLDYESSFFKAIIDIKGNKQTIKAHSPIVASCAKGVAEQRNASMKGIMSARTKKIDVIKPMAYQDKISIEKQEVVEKKQGCKVAKTPEELFELIKNEAKLI